MIARELVPFAFSDPVVMARVLGLEPFEVWKLQNRLLVVMLKFMPALVRSTREKVMVDKRLLADAAAEIEHMRRSNEILSAKVETMELFAMVLHSVPPSRGYGHASVDIVGCLQSRIAELGAKPAQSGGRGI